MSPLGDSIAVSAVGFVASVAASAFIAGSRWGEVKTQLADLKAQQGDHASKDDVQHVGERLAKIEGMFQLRLRPDQMP